LEQGDDDQRMARVRGEREPLDGVREPDQHLSRIPTRPRSGVVLGEVDRSAPPARA